MESLEEGPKSKSFIKYVFNFNDEGKAEFINALQYTFLAVIPMIILNKLLQKYVPDADEQKGTVEILAEVSLQLAFMFIGFVVINRIVTFVPTYSGIRYPDGVYTFAPTLGFIMLILSLQTKLGEKINILIDRVSELWNGKQEDDKKKNKVGNGQANVKVSQPISQNMNQMATNNAMFADGTAISNLPVVNNNMGTQQLPDYNNMHRNDSTPLVNAATPGMEGFGMMNEPMAANAALGGGAFGSW
jgi:hypothetical protein